MSFIEHIVEPTKLLLAWQASDEKHRNRYIVGELSCTENDVNLIYYVGTDDFIKAREHGFECYPAFKDVNQIHHNVLDAFMRRLPPRTRGDFPEYLTRLRLKSDVQISDFGLLGYSGAKLLSDGFSIIHPFNNVEGPCELMLEAAGYRHLQKKSENEVTPQVGQSVSFSKEEHNEKTLEKAVRIDANGTCIGYVNRGLVSTFLDWIDSSRIEGAWVEKFNGTSENPVVYIYVKIAPKS